MVACCGSPAPSPTSRAAIASRTDTCSRRSGCADRTTSSARRTPVLPLDVCVPCMRRTHLLGRLAPRIERAGRGRAAFGGLLALGDEDLVAALGARADRATHLAREAFDPDSACDAI